MAQRKHRIRDAHGLLPAETHFVKLIASGLNQRQSAKIAFKVLNLSDSSYDDKASILLDRPAIIKRLRGLVSEQKIEDVYSPGEWIRDLLAMIVDARARKNDTACASLMRLAGQALGILKDRVVVSAESVMPDADLIAQVAGGDKRKAAVLAEVIGSDTFGAGDMKKAA